MVIAYLIDVVIVDVMVIVYEEKRCVGAGYGVACCWYVFYW